MSQSFGEIQMALPVTAPTEPRARLLADVGPGIASARTELELAALLESTGITDAVAQRYGAADVFELARRAMATRTEQVAPSPAETAAAVRLPRLWPSLLRGPLMLVMIVVLMAGLRLYESALRDQGAPRWTTLAGMVAGMVLAGGIMPALGWRISLAQSQGSSQTIPGVAFFGVGTGLLIALSTAAVLVGVGALMGVPMAGLMALVTGCLGLTLLLLLSGTLMVLNQAPVVIIAPVAAFGVVWGAAQFRGVDLGPLATSATGYWIIVALLSMWLGLMYWRMRDKPKASAGHLLPPAGQLYYNALPYVVYGALAVVYVFIGPYGGWFGRLTGGWNRDPAISAVNMVHLLGFATVILTQGFTEFALRSFWQTVRSVQERSSIDDFSVIRAAVWNFVRRNLALLLVSQMVVALLTARIAPWLWQEFHLAGALGPLVPYMLYTSLLGYSYLAWGLFMCSLLVSLSQPNVAVRSLLLATVVQLVASIAISRLFGFQASVVASVIGGVALVLASYHALSKLLDRVDYVLYQAY